MKQNQITDEHICLTTKILIDKIRTNLIELEDFPYKKYEKYFKKLKYELNNYYWNI